MVLLKSDFSGELVFFQHEGMDEFLREIGVGWMMRKTAAFMDYGIGGGKTRQILTYDPDKNSLRVVMISPRGTKEVVAPMDGSVFTTPSPKAGEDVSATSQWVEDEEGLFIHTVLQENGMEAKRRIDNEGIMRIVQTINGVTAIRWFKRVKQAKEVEK